MARPKDDARLDEIRAFIQQNPDQKAEWIARHLGCDNKTVQRALTQLEERGDLLHEDDKGRLGWFGWKR
jgi:predicted ArsR family transcriptional regulator